MIKNYLVVLQQPLILGQEHQPPGGQECLLVLELGLSSVGHNLIVPKSRVTTP